ncbi:hypothetical protein [Blastococcus sp. VKM Ac-2987]|uniref:hypothetical protein n=1 Tax=Blastococcus sp. VKM Ac-2987 TaxID=3004141 RepID=UPI0022AB750B|nr:hypothetical protein [Blastococcus sp. VKM Ac-2987]MCZ2858649.1 hypothetical protein [Blastococcus sp. VKM Ac-2987]
MNRVLSAARLHVVHPLVILGVPWVVVGISFAVNLALWGSVGIGVDDPGATTWGVTALYAAVAFIFGQAVTQLLPFAMGVSLSRRVFFLGTALVAVVQAVGYGLAVATLTRIERATDGWGVALSYWAPGALSVDRFWLQVLVSGTPMLAFMAVGVGVGIVQKRWGLNGIWGLIIGLTAVLGGLIVLISWQRGWDDVGSWLGAQSIATLAVGLPIAVAAILGALAFGGIRRVVP